MTEQGMFAKPSALGDGIKWADHKGALLVIEPTAFRPEIPTQFGVSDAVEANVHVVDGPGAVHVYTGTFIFPRALVRQTRNQVGTKVLGRLGQGPQKPGQSPPWQLNEPTEADVVKATAYMSGSEATLGTLGPKVGATGSTGRQGWSDDDAPPF